MSDASQEKLPVRADGLYVAGQNDLPNSVGVIAHERNSSPSGIYQTKRVTAVNGENNSVNQDVALHHSDGDEITAANPLPVYPVDAPGDDFHIPSGFAALTRNSGATGEYIYENGTGDMLKLKKVVMSSSDKAKLVVATKEDGAASFVEHPHIYTNSVINNAELVFDPPITVENGGQIRFRGLNRSATDDQDLYFEAMGIFV